MNRPTIITVEDIRNEFGVIKANNAPDAYIQECINSAYLTLNALVCMKLDKYDTYTEEQQSAIISAMLCETKFVYDHRDRFTGTTKSISIGGYSAQSNSKEVKNINDLIDERAKYYLKIAGLYSEISTAKMDYFKPNGKSSSGCLPFDIKEILNITDLRYIPQNNVDLKNMLIGYNNNGAYIGTGSNKFLSYVNDTDNEIKAQVYQNGSWKTLSWVKNPAVGMNYNDLINLPTINGVPVQGDQKSEYYHLVSKEYVDNELLKKQDKLSDSDTIEITQEGKKLVAQVKYGIVGNDLYWDHPIEYLETINAYKQVAPEDDYINIIKDTQEHQNVYSLKKDELFTDVSSETIKYDLTTQKLETDISGVMKLIYPVGSIYITKSSTFKPSTTFGGTWTVEEKVLLDKKKESVRVTTSAQHIPVPEESLKWYTISGSGLPVEQRCNLTLYRTATNNTATVAAGDITSGADCGFCAPNNLWVDTSYIETVYVWTRIE